MIIEVHRIYISSGFESDIMINTDYIRTIEEAENGYRRIVMEGTTTDPHIFYVQDAYSGLKTRIMGQRKK